jgi:hypothetical protein
MRYKKYNGGFFYYYIIYVYIVYFIKYNYIYNINILNIIL